MSLGSVVNKGIPLIALGAISLSNSIFYGGLKSKGRRTGNNFQLLN